MSIETQKDQFPELDLESLDKLVKRWLENFAYKTAISWWIFAFSGILAISIAIFTVSYQSWKAATANPTESLRYE